MKRRIKDVRRVDSVICCAFFLFCLFHRLVQSVPGSWCKENGKRRRYPNGEDLKTVEIVDIMVVFYNLSVSSVSSFPSLYLFYQFRLVTFLRFL